ncbi:MAG TPA: ATP-binding cassette domain-containing protein [Bryobacteraceae bacterium]|nr:ATP-binding cassette domain-containing protein [Bryobacteraceae bacterium]
MGCYPGPVVPIGRLAGRLVAIYHSEDGETEAIEIADRAKFVVHDAGLAATLSSYNAATELLFASSPAKVEAYQLRYEKVDLLRFRHYSEDPFYRLTLSSATDSLETIKQDVKACLQKILVSAPDLAPSWYADWRQKLGDRYPSVELPTDFGEFVGLLPPVSTSYASVQRGALTAVSQQSSVPLARLEQVHKVFVTDEIETHALVDINLSIYRGEYVMIAGPSGCGKSSLLAILGLLDSPTRGGYFINGVPVSQLSLKERARIRDHEIGFVFQAFNLIGDLNVFENVELPLTYRGVSATERRRRVGEALEKVHWIKWNPVNSSGSRLERGFAALHTSV